MRTSRRRFLQIVAAAGTLGAAAPLGAGVSVVRWRGTALGALGSITLHHPEPARARQVLERCAAEIRRLEAIFSLYRPDSAISRLNRDGRLPHPPFELLELIGWAHAVSEASAGAFDLTVQPLWEVHARHFTTPEAAPTGPDERAVKAARALVDYRLIDMAPDAVRFARPGMAITPNGIAQGYITDRIADRLRTEGFGHVLVDLGEIRALGSRGGGRPWQIGLEGGVVPLEDRAIATSDPLGTTFGSDPGQHHLLDPRTGRPALHACRITVTAPSATLADALSTAHATAAPEIAKRLKAFFPQATLHADPAPV